MPPLQRSIRVRIINQCTNGLMGNIPILEMLTDLAGWGYSLAAIAKQAGLPSQLSIAPGEGRYWL